MDELFDRLVAEHVPNTHKLEWIFLGFIIREHKIWQMRTQEWKDYFSSPILLETYNVIASCKKKVNKDEVGTRLKESLALEDFNAIFPNVENLLSHDSKIAEKIQNNFDKHDFNHVRDTLQMNMRRKKMIRAACMIIANATGDPLETSKEARKILSSIISVPVPMSRFLDPAHIEARFQRYLSNKDIPRWKTGIDSLDIDLGGGFMWQDFAILIAPSGMGKSMFLSHLAYSGMLQGAHIVMFQGEMSTDQSDMRLDSRIGSVLTNKFRSGEIEETDLSQVKTGLSIMQDRGGSLTTYYMNRKNFHVDNMHSCLDALRGDGIIADLVLVDYVLLMSSPGAENKSEQERLRIIGEGLNDLSNDFERDGEHKGVAVVTVSQGKPGMKKTKNISAEEATGYSQALLQSANILYTLTADDDDLIMKRMTIQTLKNRFGSSGNKHHVFPNFYISSLHDSMLKTDSEETI